MEHDIMNKMIWHLVKWIWTITFVREFHYTDLGILGTR
jgi:hypothetical protein